MNSRMASLLSVFTFDLILNATLRSELCER